MPNFNDQDSAPNGKSVYPFNVLGKIAAKPFYIWVNDDCSNKSDSFTEAKAVRLELFNDGGATAYIVDADGVEVVDAEIEAHEVLAKHDYFAGARKPEIRPDCSGAFMVNDPQDPDGYAIVGDDIAALIMEARDHLLTKSPVRDVPISTDKSSCIADAKSSHVDGEVIGIDGDGCLIQWDGQAGVAYNSGHDVQGFGMDNLSQLEKERLNLSVSGLASFDYQLLARLQQDCDYYLGHGNRSKKHLWAGGEAEQIAKMKELYSGLKEKPEWISLDDIDTYEARMLNFVTHPSSGKTGTFAARFDQHADRNGQTFTLIGTLDSGAYDKAECGEMFVVRFADGVEIHAWPEEVQSAINAVDGKAQLAFDQKLQGKVERSSFKGTRAPDADSVYALSDGRSSRYLDGQWRSPSSDIAKAMNETRLDAFPSPQFRTKNHHRWSVVEGNVLNYIEQASPATSVPLGPKLYRAEVRGGGDLDVAPSVAVFQVDEQLARDVVKFASLVKANDVYKIERYDYRAEFLQYDPETESEDAEEAGEENSVRTDCDCLVVTDTEFFFRAYVRHTSVGVECSSQSISDLAKHFGLPFGEPQAQQSADQTSAQTTPDLSGLGVCALTRELERRGLLVQLWSPDDFEFIGNEDEETADLSGEVLDQIQQQAFEECRRSLEEITTQRGNEHLGDWWAMNKKPILERIKVNGDSPAPGM